MHGWECKLCGRQRWRKPRCPIEECDGPTYGDGNWCPTHGKRRPDAPLEDDQVSITLVNPRGEEREVYRVYHDKIPGLRESGRVNRKRTPNGEIECSLVTLRMIKRRYIVVDVTMPVWRSARLV